MDKPEVWDGNFNAQPATPIQGKKTVVDILLEKAMNASDATQAMNYAQAACNAAHARKAQADAKRA